MSSNNIDSDVLPKGVDVISATPQELSALAGSMGQPAYRGEQLFDWIHKKGVLDSGEMSNLPADFRNQVDALGSICPLEKGRVLASSDGTRKLEVLLRDGAVVETVLIPEDGKLTQCISSQVGCAVACDFCRSGKGGLQRNLTAAEIIGQVALARTEYTRGERLRNVVFMGVGEPLHNIERVLRALEIFCHPQGTGLSSRRVTVSTVGVPGGIDRLGVATGGNAALAVSLHAADDETRRRLVPGIKAPLADIVAALKRYPLPKRRRFTIEYVMVKGINDRDSDARNLVRLLSRLRVKINLLPLNPHDLTDLEPPDGARVEAFQQILISKGVSAFMRRRRGADINAACGQLLAIETAPTTS